MRCNQIYVARSIFPVEVYRFFALHKSFFHIEQIKVKCIASNREWVFLQYSSRLRAVFFYTERRVLYEKDFWGFIINFMYLLHSDRSNRLLEQRACPFVR